MQISDMKNCRRRFLRKIELQSVSWQSNQAWAAFRMLKDATALRTMKVHHSNVCSSFDSWSWRYRNPGTSPEVFVVYVDRALRGILNARRVNDHSGLDTLNIIEITWERCSVCKNGFPEDDKMCFYAKQSGYYGGCRTPCKKGEKHCQDMTDKIRKLLMTRLNIKILEKQTEDDDGLPSSLPLPEIGGVEEIEGLEEEEEDVW
jgi:hypothetical protein